MAVLRGTGQSQDEAVVAALRNPRTRSSAFPLVGGLPDAMLPSLVRLLTVQDQSVQHALLARFRQSAVQAVRLLEKTTTEPNPARRAAAATALAAMEGPTADLALARLVAHGDRVVRGIAVSAVGRRHVRVAVPALLEALENYEWETRRLAADSLSQIGDPATCIELVPLLDDEHVLVRRSALIALGRLAAPRTILAVARFAEDHDQKSRQRAEEAVRETVAQHPESLLLLLDSADEGCRALAIDLLIELGVDIAQLAECRGCQTNSEALSDTVCGWLGDLEWPEILGCLEQADDSAPWLIDFVDSVVGKLDASQLADLHELFCDCPILAQRIEAAMRGSSVG